MFSPLFSAIASAMTLLVAIGPSRAAETSATAQNPVSTAIAATTSDSSPETSVTPGSGLGKTSGSTAHEALPSSSETKAQPTQPGLGEPSLTSAELVGIPANPAVTPLAERATIATDPSDGPSAPVFRLHDVPADPNVIPVIAPGSLPAVAASELQPLSPGLEPVVGSQANSDRRAQAAPSGPSGPTSQPEPGLTAPIGPSPIAPSQPGPDTEPRVLVGEVVVTGVSEALQSEVYRVIRTRPGQTTTRSQLQEDINRVFATGLFGNVRAFPEDTPLGVRVTFAVEPNPVLRQVAVKGATVLPEGFIEKTFGSLYGTTLNLNQLQDGIKAVNKWYQDNGYVLAQFIGSPQVSPDGTVTLEVAEGTVEAIKVAYLNDEGKLVDADGKPIQGRTKEYIVTREMELKPGAVFNRNTVQADLRRVFNLGIFEDVQLTLNPGKDPRQVEVSVNVQEKNTAVLGAEVGFSSATGVFGTASFQQQNVGGNNQKFGSEVQLSERGLGFNISFTDPWIGGDPNRTSYTVNVYKQRSISLIFDGGPNQVRLANGDRPRIDRTGGRVTFTRPLSKTWTASLGLEYQHVIILDAGGNKVLTDALGNHLSFSGKGSDDMLTIQLGAVNDLRNDKLFPTSGSLFRIATEQSIPIASSIFFNRTRVNYSRYFPVNFTNFMDGPEALAFNIQGGAVLGDLPPYEAFPLGGTNSVRGYGEGAVGSARYFIQASAEYRFPIFKVTEQIPISGVLFLDFASDLGSGSDVPGNPAGIRKKPGSGVGVGFGIRARTPFGPIRLDYGWGDNGEGRLHFGIGERF